MTSPGWVTGPGEERTDGEQALPVTWGEKLRAAASWFDLVDRLLDHIEIKPVDGEPFDLRERIPIDRTIQADLLFLADKLDVLEGVHKVTLEQPSAASPGVVPSTPTPGDET